METTPRTPDWILEARRIADAADQGPWHQSRADDDKCATALYVARGEFKRGRWPSPEQVVAVTMLQSPVVAVSDAARSNTAFIAAARELVPRLCAEVERLRAQRMRAANALRQLSSSTASASGDSIRRDLLGSIVPLIKELEAE